MSRVGARREREGTVPRATAVPRLAKPARHAGYAPGAHRSIGGCRRSGEAARLRRAGQRIATEVSAGRAVPRLSRRLSPAATWGARGSPSVPLSRPVPTRDVSRVGLLGGGAVFARVEVVHGKRETRNLASGRVAVEHALGDRLVERAGRTRQAVGGLLRVARRDRGAHRPDEVLQLRADGLVAEPALHALTVALQRRGMFRHGRFATMSIRVGQTTAIAS